MRAWATTGILGATVALAAPVGATTVADINFQPAASAVPSGYTADTGAAYTGARGFGWVRQDNGAPLDLTRNTRDRARSGVDPRLNTLIHMQYGDIGGANGVTTAGAWQFGVAPGTYTVTVSAGDQPAYDSVHVVRVEGVTAIDHFRSATATEYATGTVTVPVSDGLLTVDAIGGTNTKLNYLHIGRVVLDSTAPAAPTGLAAQPGDHQAVLSWAASTSTDVLGYRVYRDGTPITGAGLVTATTLADVNIENTTSHAYAVSTVDTSGNESVLSAPVTATAAAFAVKVNFADQSTAPPAGYLTDYGQAYGDRGNGRTYGWVSLDEGTPLSLAGNGRNRGTAANADVRLATLLHAQLPSGSAGVHTPGAWELAVPNGRYTVTAVVGDAGTAVDSAHYLNIEDQNGVAAFVPTAAAKFGAATRTVTVADGKLTLSPKAGTNTKFDYVDVASVPAAAAIPAVRTMTPANLATDVPPTASVVADLRLPAGGVDPASLSSGSVRLTRVSDGTAVDINVITSGGGDVINASPRAPLAANTLYRLDVTSAVKDVVGNGFSPYSMVFSTGSASGGSGPAFDKVASGALTAQYTSVTKGPDGRLYAATLDGHIYRYPVNTDGTLGTPTVIDTVRNHATSAGLPGAPNRTVIGLAFDPASTAAAPILWVSDNYEFVGTYDVPDWSSKIARLSGADLGAYTEVVTNLPRSVKDHETNSLAFGPDGALYFTQGANNAMGAPDSAWGNRAEHLLNAAVLRLDPAKLPATLPLDVKTSDGGAYDPAAAGAALTLYATGVRNAYDLVWHRNGHLYTPTNGSAAGGNTPASTTCPGYSGPAVPAIASNPQAETDYVFDVKPGRYYGHPNPTRCQWVLAGGNPTGGADPFQVDAYPVGTLPDANLDLPDMYDAGLHASADGAIEYRGGALDGKLLVVRYSDGQDIETFDVTASGALANRTTGVTGFTGFSQPLDVTEDTATGNLYVTELGASRITLLRPHAG